MPPSPACLKGLGEGGLGGGRGLRPAGTPALPVPRASPQKGSPAGTEAGATGTEAGVTFIQTAVRRFGGPDLVPEVGGPFEFEFFGGGLHFPFEAGDLGRGVFRQVGGLGFGGDGDGDVVRFVDGGEDVLDFAL